MSSVFSKRKGYDQAGQCECVKDDGERWQKRDKRQSNKIINFVDDLSSERGGKEERGGNRI